MNNSASDTKQSPSARPRFAAAVWTLLILAPFIGELLSGSTRTSVLFVLVPEIMVWGVGALFCRELARRWRAGVPSLLLLGMALSVAEEFIIQQTSIAPLPFPGAHADYGRLWGINLVYLLFMLGFESLWIVVVPVQITELFFPQKAAQAWLRLRGTIVGCVAFLLGSWIAWYGWTQQARPRLHAASYHPPAALIGLGFGAIAALVAVAYLIRNFGAPSNDGRKAIPAWIAGVTAFVMGAVWFEVVAQCFMPKPAQPFWIVIAAGVAWAVLAFALFFRWSSRQGWNEVHRYSAAIGATLACMAAPYFTIATWPKVDVIGEVIFDIITIAGILVLARKVLARQKVAKAQAVSL